MLVQTEQSSPSGAQSGAELPDMPDGNSANGLGDVAIADRTGDWVTDAMSGVPAWGQSIIIIAVLAGVFVLVQSVAYAILRRLNKDDKRAAAGHLVKNTSRPARGLAFVTGASMGLAACDERGLLAEPIAANWGSVAVVLGILCVTWLIVGLISGGDDLILARYRVDVKDNLRARRLHTQVAVISRILRVVVVIVGVAVALMTFESVEKLGASVLASAGIAGIAVGFAAKSVLGNLLAGIQIALTQPIRLDDAVVISGEWGRIEEITTTYVVVRIWDKRRLIVPFSKIIEEPFENWTRKSSDIIGVVLLYADYTCEIDAVREKLDEIVHGTEMWDGETQVVQVTESSPRTQTIRVLVSAGDSSTAWDLRCHVRERLIAWLQQDHPEWLPRERQVNLGDGPGDDDNADEASGASRDGRGASVRRAGDEGGADGEGDRA